MKQTARLTIFGLNLLVAGTIGASFSLAADPQKCTTSQTCKIGEFLYDDDYNPITSATCSITSRDPDGNIYLNGTAMTHSASGYYIYSFTPTSLGLYPTQVCCVVNSENMCLDKTFEVVSASSGSGGGSSLTAADVWNYSDRSLTSFGTLTSDIWGYSSRSLTSFGSLVSDIWNRSERTLTQSVSVDTTNLATKNDLLEIKKQNQENRLLLEKLVNKPIIETFIDDKNPQDLDKKLTETQNVLNSLFTTSQNLKNRTQILTENWNKLTTTQARSELTEIKKIITDQNNSSTIISHLNWLKTTWGSDIHINLYAKANAILGDLEILETNLQGNSQTSLLPNIQSFSLEVFGFDNLVGHNFNEPTDNTAFGHFQNIKMTADKLTQIDKTLTENIGQKENNELIEKVTNDLLKINQISNAENLLNSTKKPTYKNKIYSLISLVNLNKKVLAGDNSKIQKLMWLEDGSIVFRSVATNPSKSVAQSVEVKFYLPEELKKEQIISSDPLLKIDYDPIQKSLFAKANIDLLPLETVSFAVETEDIWHFSEEEISLLKKQADNFTNILKGKSNFTQAQSINTDIQTSLDKILLKQSQAITPENRIKTYRESSLDILNVEEKIEALKQLGLQSTNNNLGINTQNLATVGIIVMGLASFLFLGYYLKVLAKHKVPPISSLGETLPTSKTRTRLQIHKKTNNHHYHKLTTIAIIGLFTSGLISLIGSVTFGYHQNQKARELSLQTSSIIQSSPVILKANNNQIVVAKSSPSLVAPETDSFNQETQVYVYKKLNGWAKIGVTKEDDGKNNWVSEAYLK